MITAKKKAAAKPAKKVDAAKYKKWALYAVLFLVFMKINKAAAFIALFSVVTTMGKFMRTRLGLSMIVFDPLLFCAILTMKYFGFVPLAIFVSINTLLMDAPTGMLEFGSFVNWVLYIGCPAIAYLILGGTSLGLYGNIANFLYGGIYILQKLTIFPGDPFNSVAKGVTSTIFTFLYLTILGPVFHIILS